MMEEWFNAWREEYARRYRTLMYIRWFHVTWLEIRALPVATNCPRCEICPSLPALDADA